MLDEPGSCWMISVLCDTAKIRRVDTADFDQSTLKISNGSNLFLSADSQQQNNLKDLKAQTSSSKTKREVG